MKKTVVLILLLFIKQANAQLSIGNDTTVIDYANPKEYEIGGIIVSGTEYLDKSTLMLISGLSIGDKIKVPGDKISTAILNLWKQGLFEDVKILTSKIQGKNIFLDIRVSERPRLSKFSFKGIKKGEADDLRDKIKLIKGKVLTEYLLSSTTNTIKEHFIDKGFSNVSVQIKEQKDTSIVNSVILYITIKKGEKIKIQDIFLHGNEAISNAKIIRYMKESKRKRWWNIFNSGKYLEENLEKDKEKIIEKYREKGFRDVKIIKDSVYKINPERINIDLTISEGKKYYFRNITWIGNTKYSSKELSALLSIKKGDVFDQSVLDAKLFMNPNGNDVSSLYMDDGYLFFQVTPVEVLVENDSIDFEMRIYEGKQAIINKVTVSGNTKTNDRVIMREIRTKPGQLFRRSDIIRSQRELSQLGYFNPEKMAVNPTPNPATGTVDINYVVEEKPSDQIELSGGWGANRVVGTLGLTFNNFSARNMFKGEAWRPLPSGDGQRLSIRAQSTGLFYQSYNLSFTEPWLGGKRPNSLTYTIYHSIQNPAGVKMKSNGETNPAASFLTVTGVSLGLGKRLKRPDDYFTLYQELNYQYYSIHNYNAIANLTTGYANNFSYKFNISRNSVDKPIFETKGSQISFTAQLTPPYSYLGRKIAPNASAQDRYLFLEYQKFKFTSAWYTSLTSKRDADGKEARNLVLYTKFGAGFLGSYNSQVGLSPFERFYLGGGGLTGYVLDGREIIALRGYDDRALSPSTGAASIYKYTMELRFPFSLNPQATIYGLGFAEAGNSWESIKKFNPFEIKRSVGAGVRIFLPMFGLLGFDYGWGLDAPNLKSDGTPNGHFHFIIGYSLGEL